jgi:hypothetical protein
MPLRQIFPPIDVPRTLRHAVASTLRTTLRIARTAQYLSSWRSNGSPPKHFLREYKSGRRVVIPDWRGPGDLRREYALVYRAGLLNQTGRPVGVGLPDKLYDFAHLVTSAGNLEEIFPPNTPAWVTMRISCQAHLKTSGEPGRIALPRRMVSPGPLAAPIAFHLGRNSSSSGDRLACIAPGRCACYAKAVRTL